MSLIVFPAIDLKGGQVVRLAEGDMDRATVYGDDPAAQALLFAEAGAGHLHVVDLDGAFAGKAVNAEAVESIVKAFPGHVQLGGGIRNREAIERWFDLGVSRVVIGTAALEDPDLVRQASADFPGGIVVAVDARDGMVATKGWADVSTVSILDMAPSTHANSLEAYKMLHDVASDALIELGATITHHHAVGKSFRPWYDKEVDPLFRRVLAAAKTELDPKWMLNPGLIVDKPAGLKIVG